MENLHVQGYLRYWDELARRDPGVFLIDSCASGGRRNDLEAMRRAVPLHYTDIGYGNHPIKQKQHRLMYEWIPYFRSHNMNWLDAKTNEYGGKCFCIDEFSFLNAMAPAVADMTAHNAAPEQIALAKRMTAIWRTVAPYLLSGDYYPLTECRKSAEDFYAMQFHDERAKSGFFQIISNARNSETKFNLKLNALQSDAKLRHEC